MDRSRSLSKPPSRDLESRSPKSRIIAVILALFGFFGLHRFYVGKFWTGLLQLVTFGGFTIWWIIDVVLLVMGRFTDAEGRVLGPPQVTEHRTIDERSPADDLPGTRRDKPPHDEAAGEGVTMGSIEEDGAIDADEDELLEDPLKKEFDELEKEMDERSQ